MDNSLSDKPTAVLSIVGEGLRSEWYHVLLLLQHAALAVLEHPDKRETSWQFSSWGTWGRTPRRPEKTAVQRAQESQPPEAQTLLIVQAEPKAQPVDSPLTPTELPAQSGQAEQFAQPVIIPAASTPL